MFPYVCLATMPLFCHVDWPRKIEARLFGRSKNAVLHNQFQPEPSDTCENIIEEKQTEACCKSQRIRSDSEKTEDNFENLVSKTNSKGEYSSYKESPANIEDKNTATETSNGQRDFGMSNGAAAEDDIDKRRTASCSNHVDKRRKKYNVTRKQKTVVALLLFHVFMQLFLPYSHFITKVLKNI